MSVEAEQEPILFHSHYNYQAAAYERVEQFMRNTLHIVSQPPEFFKTCGKCKCFSDFATTVPEYLNTKVDDFIKSLKDKPEGSHKARVEEVMTMKANKAKETLESIKVRI